MPARYEHSEALRPYLVEFVQELVVVDDVAKLARIPRRVGLEVRVGR
jgi:hypothetical protein